MKMKRMLARMAFLAAITGSPDAHALAGEVIVYPVSMCTYEGVTDSTVTGNSIKTYFTTGGYLYNLSSSSSVFAVCPIPRQSTAGAYNVNILDDVKVYYRDRNTTSNVSCTVQAIDSDLANIMGASFTSIGSNAATQVWSSGPISGVAFNVRHQTYLYCEIPVIDPGPPAVDSRLIEYIVDYP